MIEAFINENAPIYVITIVMVLYSNLKQDRLIFFCHVTEMFYWYNYDNVLFLIGLLFEAYETYTPVLILFCVTKVLSSLCFLLVYKFSSQTQKTYITEVKLPQKEAFLEDKTVLTPLLERKFLFWLKNILVDILMLLVKIWILYYEGSEGTDHECIDRASG